MRNPLIIFIIFLLTSGMAVSSMGMERQVLPPMIVTATRTPITIDRSAANLTVITAEDIKRLPARNLAEALSYNTAVVIDHNGGLGSQATASIYGSEVRHVAVYMDGVPLNLLGNPLTDLSRIPLDRIDRIEIYKGAASSVWGSALGGVIQIVTKEPNREKPVSFRLDTMAGEFNTWMVQPTLEFGADRTGFLVTSNRTHSLGFTTNHKYDLDSQYFKAQHGFSEKTGLTLSVLRERSIKEEPFLLLPIFYERAEAERYYESLKFKSEIKPGLSTEILAFHQDVFLDDNLHFFAGGDLNNFTYGEHGWGIRAMTTLDRRETGGRGHTVTFGLDQESGVFDFSTLRRDVTARNRDAWVSDTYDLGPVSFNVGGRLDDNKNFGTEFSPSAGMAYRPEWVPAIFRLQWAKGFSAPPLSALYNPNTGNPNLGPETGYTWQMGGEFFIGNRITFSTNLFRADISDMIYFDPVLRKPVNLDKVRRDALEMTSEIRLPAGFAASGGVLWVNVDNRRTGEEVPDIPKRTYRFQVSHNFKGLRQSINGRWIDYNSSYSETKDRMWVYDYQVSHEFGDHLEARVSVHNFTDVEEFHYPFLLHPGRWAEAGLTFKF